MPAAQPLRDDPIDLAHANWSQQGWGDAADGMAVVTSIMRVQQVLLARVEAILRPLGLTFARYEVLMLLLFSRNGCLPVGKIGERLQVHPASVTNAVHRLEQDRFVIRSANPVDGRSVLAEITPRGRKLATEGDGAAQRPGFLARADFADEQQEVYSVLKGMRRAFGDFL